MKDLVSEFKDRTAVNMVNEDSRRALDPAQGGPRISLETSFPSRKNSKKEPIRAENGKMTEIVKSSKRLSLKRRGSVSRVIFVKLVM